MMQEQSHERELIDLLEDIEALKANHQEDIDAANSKKIVWQKRVKKLLKQKAAFENDKVNVRSFLICSVAYPLIVVYSRPALQTISGKRILRFGISFLHWARK